MQHLLRATTQQVKADLSPRERAVASRVSVEQLFSSDEPIALFLDIDGTLLDIALTPSTVHVPSFLPCLLNSLSARLSGSLAIITGRPLEEADDLLWPSKFVAAGVHGGEMRLSANSRIERLSPNFDPALQTDIKKIVRDLSGVIFEDKGSGIALHYRLAPNQQLALLQKLEALIPTYPNQFRVCSGRKVVEINPIVFSKGRALRKLASLPQFVNRTPVMIGDDISDIDAFHAAEDLGGFGLKVLGENFSKEESSFRGPTEVLEWLQILSRTGSGKT